MSGHFWLSDAQDGTVAAVLSVSPEGKPRVDDRRVLSGIIYVQKERFAVEGRAGRVWAAEDAVQIRFVRWGSRNGAWFARIFADLAQPGPDGETDP